MKKLLSLLFITVASVLPKSVWAEEINSSNPAITKDGSTLTINSTTAGSLKTLMDGWKTKGEKNDEEQAADDAKIASMKACTSVKLEGKFQENDLSAISNTQEFNFTEVDMKEARFVQAVENTNSFKLFSSTASGTAFINQHAIEGGSLYVSEHDRQWNSLAIAPTPESNDIHTLSDLNNANDYDLNAYGKIAKSEPVYAKLEIDGETKTWDTTTTPTDEEKSNATVISNFDYAYRENHKSDLSTAGWYKMTDYDYYQNVEASTWHWKPLTFDEGAQYTINKQYADDEAKSEDSQYPNANAQYAIVGGTEKVYDGSQWQPRASVTELPNYSAMKFSYWSGSLQKATTSRYADESISDQIFDNCTHLTEVNFLGGNVIGLKNRTTSSYPNFTVFIGKDVSQISSDAFSQSPALTGVTFDKDYSDSDEKKIPGKTYPVELTIKDKAFMYCYNLSSIEIPNRTISIEEKAFERVGNKTDVNSFTDIANQEFELSFERRNSLDETTVGINCNLPLTIGGNAFLDCWYLKDLSLPIRLETLGNNCFKNNYSLKTLVMREETQASYTPPTGHDLLRTIPGGAFEASGIEELTIPKCVTLIEAAAFGSTTKLKKVTFQNNTETPKKGLTIKESAFTGGSEENRPDLDVWVDVSPSDRLIICEYDAFNFTQTVSQTSTSSRSATLHFPAAAWNYYQGDWKRGLAFRQSNLNAFKDGYSGSNGGAAGLGKASGIEINTTYGKYLNGSNQEYTPANGWQQFARTSTGIDIVIDNPGAFMRTYSTPTPQSIPLHGETEQEFGIVIGDPFYKIYRISNFNDGWTGTDDEASHQSTAIATEVKLHTTEGHANDYEDAYIPKNTGLLMVGVGTSTHAYIVYSKEVVDEGLTTYPYTEVQNGGTPNLLYPSCMEDPLTRRVDTANEKYVYLNPTYPYPYDEGSQPDFRFFGLAVETVNNNQNYYFSRFRENGKATFDKAYLRLSNDLFHWSNEGQHGTDNSGVGNNNNNNARVTLNFFDDDEYSGTTGIKQVDTTMQRVDSNVFYTLEGVRLDNRPTQRGIYIHNGRKIVIK